MDLSNKTVVEVLKDISSKKVSCKDYVQYYISNMKKYKGKNAVLEVFADAIQKAEQMDARIAAGEKLPVLAGLPILIKDNILYEGKIVSCASKFLEHHKAQYSSTVIQRLLDAGVIIIGRTNMDEFAMGSSCENSAFGACKNALDDGRVAGGSSGGSACAVACDMAPCALGSDTGASIRQPASFNGVVGIKPTYGRVSRYGIVAYASGFDQCAPITKTVEDNALLLGIIAGRDNKDETSLQAEVPNYLTNISAPIKGLKVGVIKEVREIMKDTKYTDKYVAISKWFTSQGATVTEVSVPTYKLALPVYYTITSAEAASNLSRFDGIKYSRRSENAKDISAVYNMSRTEGFGKEVKRRIMLGNFVLSSGYFDAYYLKAKKLQAALTSQFERIFKECDVVIMPTTLGEAFKLGAKTTNLLEMYIEDIFTVAANVTGIPAISVPCGKGENGLPLGLQILGKHLSEGVLYNVAHYFTKNFKV